MMHGGSFPIWGIGIVSSDYATSIYLPMCLLTESLPVTASLRTNVRCVNKACLCLRICSGPCSRRDSCLVTVWRCVCVCGCVCAHVWVKQRLTNCSHRVWLMKSSEQQHSFTTENKEDADLSVNWILAACVTHFLCVYVHVCYVFALPINAFASVLGPHIVQEYVLWLGGVRMQHQQQTLSC